MFRSHGNAYILRWLRNGKQRSIIPKNCQQHQRGSSNIWARKSQVDSSPCYNNTSLRTLGSRSEGWDDWACPQRTRRKPDSVTYYSDSKFILGYITNESCLFYVYVSNRVERICSSSAPHQWKYPSTTARRQLSIKTNWFINSVAVAADLSVWGVIPNMFVYDVKLDASGDI